MKLLLLPRYGRQGASSRYRLWQYVPLFECAGHEVQVWPLLDDSYVEELYTTGRRRATVVFSGYARRLRKLAAARGFDAALCEQEAFPCLPGAWEKLLWRCARRVFFDYDDAAYIRYERLPLLRRKFAEIMAAADGVVVGNRHLAEYARQHTSHVAIIPTVVDLARYSAQAAETSGGALRIAWIGTPVTARLLEPLAPVFARIQNKYPETVFRLIGAGESFALGGLRCETPRWSEGTEAPLLRECSLGIMPLPDTEFARGKCGLKLIQYMACGLPVVASPVGANCEIVEHGRNGFLAATPEEWEQALARLAGDSGLREQMGRAARERVALEYTIEQGFAKWMETLAGNSAGTARRDRGGARQTQAALAVE